MNWWMIQTIRKMNAMPKANIQKNVEFARGSRLPDKSARAGKNSDRSLMRMAARTIATIEKRRVSEVVRGKSNEMTHILKPRMTRKISVQLSLAPQSNWV